MQYKPLRKQHVNRTGVVTMGCILLMALWQQPSARAQGNGGPVSETSYASVLGESGGPGDSRTDPGTSSAISKSLNVSGGSGFAAAAVTPATYAFGAATPDMHATATVAVGSEFGVGAAAMFSDTLDVSVVLGATLPVTFKFHYLVDGSLSGNANGSFSVLWGSSEMFFSPSGGVQAFQVVISTANLTFSPNGGDGNGSYTGAFSETLGASVNNNAGPASADFGNTAKLAEIEAYDANGNPVAARFFDTYNDWTTGPLSFPANTLLVPEPSTWALLGLGTGLLGVVTLRLRRSRTA